MISSSVIIRVSIVSSIDSMISNINIMFITISRSSSSSSSIISSSSGSRQRGSPGKHEEDQAPQSEDVGGRTWPLCDYVYVCICVYMCVDVCICVYVCIYIYI